MSTTDSLEDGQQTGQMQPARLQHLAQELLDKYGNSAGHIEARARALAQRSSP